MKIFLEAKVKIAAYNLLVNMGGGDKGVRCICNCSEATVGCFSCSGIKLLQNHAVNNIECIDYFNKSLLMCRTF